ncbi:MAG: hypothetical protein WC527_00620 [Candidatus Margulisiibacteriota bacterium]
MAGKRTCSIPDISRKSEKTRKMKNKFKLKDSDIDMDILRRSAKMTPLQRMKWLQESRDFYLKAIPRSTLRAVFALRKKENGSC